MHDKNGTGDGTHPYNGAWHAAQTKVPSESNLLYLPLPVHKKEVSNSRVMQTVSPDKSLAENNPSLTRRLSSFLPDDVILQRTHRNQDACP